MKHFDKICKLHNLLCAHRTPLSGKAIEEKLECSRATRERLIAELRDYLFAPIIYDAAANGYSYDHSQEKYELPGLWFNSQELQALLACQHLLSNISPGILQSNITQLQGRLEKLLSHNPGAVRPDFTKIKILSQAERTYNDTVFLQLAAALFNGKRLQIAYHARSDDRRSRREISPQTLVRYRDNWYLDAWCHDSRGLRSFAADRIAGVKPLAANAEQISAEQLQDYYASSYGIFSGSPKHTAVLNFSPHRARWVADEQWHPQQQGTWLDDGRYQLRIPFNKHEELLMDILKHGAEVEVVEPGFLVQAVQAEIAKMQALYAKPA